MTPDTLSTRTDIAGATERRLLNCFFVLFKTALLVDEGNSLFTRQRDKFVSTLAEVVGQQGETTINRVADRYFVNGLFAPFDDSGLTESISVIGNWEKLRIGGVTFHGEVGPDDVSAFFRLLADLKPRSENVEIVTRWLQEHQLANISLLRLPDEDEDESGVERRQRLRRLARGTYRHSLRAIETVMSNISESQVLSRNQMRRSVNRIVSHILKDEQSLLELTAIKDFDDYTAAHSVNVCIYALTLGLQVGLDRQRLSQLGQAALLHDLGKARLNQQLVRKPGNFTESEWTLMRLHPMLGAKSILKSLAFSPVAVRAARVAFEHHLAEDFSGYPVLKLEHRHTNFFSKIISIVDAYDALTSGRTYMTETLLPVMAVTRLIERMGVQTDPLLLKLFASTIGAWPAGSLVFLRSAELALVVAANSDDPARPMVRIVGDKSGLHDQPEIVDLSEADQAGRAVERPADPEDLGLSPSRFILGG
jgi:HD-GYP domain-containing protein (c-di-GMP phosphodiesterase class II)